ncbi:MAG: hypothetical protein RLZZ546_262, partial [Bacteroidota bacterium]
PESHTSLNKHEIQYLTGGWFEEWCYYQIKSKFELTDEQMGLGLIVNAIANNDLDVVFLLNNNLFVVECKTLLGRDLQQSTIYKSGALIEKFGKAAQAVLLTLQDLREKNGDLKASIDLRARQQNVIIKDRKDIINFDQIKF